MQTELFHIAITSKQQLNEYEDRMAVMKIAEWLPHPEVRIWDTPAPNLCLKPGAWLF
jgi:hypothetical protein